MADSLEIIGLFHFANMLDYEKALEHYQQSLAIREDLNYLYGMAKSYFFIGAVYFDTYDKDKALDYYQKSLTLMKQLHYTHEIAWLYFQMGETYGNYADFELGEEYLQKGLELFEKLENPKGQAVCYMRLSNLAHTVYRNFTQAQSYLQQTLDLWVESGIKSYNYSVAIHIQGWYQRELGQLDQALKSFQRSLAINKNLGIPLQQQGQTLQDIGSIYRLKGDYQQAFTYYQKAFAIQKKLSGNFIVDGQKTWTCYYLIVLITQYFPQENVAPFLEELEQINKLENPLLKHIYPIAKALYLKASKRVADHYKAQEILKDVVKTQKFYDPNLGFTAQLTLCELLLQELKTSGESEVFQELKTLVGDVELIAEQQNLILAQIEMKILQAKLAQVEGKFDDSNQLLEQTFQLTQKNNLLDMVNKIKYEQQLLADSFETFNELIEKNASMSQKLKQLQISRYIDHAQQVITGQMK
jgi:tetratricopeptide (TPR) repeat protein